MLNVLYIIFANVKRNHVQSVQKCNKNKIKKPNKKNPQNVIPYILLPILKHLWPSGPLHTHAHCMTFQKLNYSAALTSNNDPNFIFTPLEMFRFIYIIYEDPMIRLHL